MNDSLKKRLQKASYGVLLNASLYKEYNLSLALLLPV